MVAKHTAETQRDQQQGVLYSYILRYSTTKMLNDPVMHFVLHAAFNINVHLPFCQF